MKNDFVLGRMCFTENDSYQNLLVLVTMLNSLILDNHKNLLAGCRVEYIQNNLNLLSLALHQKCLM